MKDKLILTDLYFKPTSITTLNTIPEISKIVCAKNEKASFVIIINNEGKNARFVGDNSPSLGIFSTQQYRISVDCPFGVKLKPVGYIKDNNEIKTADLIYSATSLDYAGDELPYIICDFTLPNDVKTGIYNVTINLYSSCGLNDEQLLQTKTLSLCVKPVELPTPNEYTLYNDIWQHNSNIARTFGVALWSEEHYSLIGKVLDMLVKLGQKSATIVVSDCPWRGWGCYLMRDNPANMFEYSCVNTTLTNGKFAYDYTALDKLIALYTNKGIDGDITLYGLIGIWRMPFFNTAQVDYPEQIKIRYTDLADGGIKYMQKKQDIINYISALFEHLKDIGVWDKVRIGADEPSVIESFMQNLKILKEITPNIKLKLAIDKPDIISSLGELTEDIAFSFPCTLDNHTKAIAANRKFYYVCNIPDRPNSQLHNSVTDNVAVFPLNHMFGFDGFLRWAFTCWTTDPLHNIKYNANGLPAGDMYLIYPAQNGEMLESIRYRAYYHGIMLYELLAKVKAKDKETFDRLLAKIIDKNKDFYMITDNIGISQNINDYRELYIELLDMLSVEEN